MKNLLILIGFMTLTMNVQGQNEYQESTFQGQEEVSQHDPKVDLINSSSVGQTIKIGNLEIMKKDLGLFNWDDANVGISKLGGGWRLPTKKELFILNVNKKINVITSEKTWEHNVRAVRTISPTSQNNKNKTIKK
jgi:hypothetical protein